MAPQAGAEFKDGTLVERPDVSGADEGDEVGAISKARDEGCRDTGRHVCQLELPVRFGCLTGEHGWP